MRRSLFALAFCTLAGTALAQTDTVRVRGTIEATDGHTLQVTSREGDKLRVALPASVPVIEIVPASITDIKPGTYIGTAAMPQTDGSVRALEVQVFPENMRGAGEGSHPFDLRPQSTMTNGTVGNVVGTEGRVLTLRYQGQEKKVTVPADAPIITYEPGSLAMLSPGAHVIVMASRAADGTLTATRVSVGKDGLTPPM